MLKKILCLFLIISMCSCKSNWLPRSEADENRDFGIDRNINEKTIDQYLNREDTVYRDMRMLFDEAEFEAIGGDSYLSGFVEGFEVVPFPYICNVIDLPEEVGHTYTGTTLFSYIDGQYTANYKESMDILESLFPKDKNIFLMCGGGGYSGMMKDLLIALGWDAYRIYNVGGYWYYEGSNNIDVKYEIDGETFYNLAIVNYHSIDFDTLNLIGQTSDIDTTFNLINDLDELNNTIKNTKSFALYIYLPGCSTCASYTPIMKELVEDKNIDMYALSLNSIWKTNNPITDLISVAPSLFVFKNGKVANYIEASKIINYRNVDDFYNWLNENIDIKLISKNCDSCTIN